MNNINPCKACMEKISAKGYYDINDLNNCCYETLAAFEGTTTVNAVRNLPAAENCKKCISNYMHKFPQCIQLAPPPVFGQAPHYLPNLLRQDMTVEEAYKKCVSMCNENRYPNECKENCHVDMLAVNQTVENYEPMRRGQCKGNYKGGIAGI